MTTTTTKPETTIATLLAAARENLARYEAMGDERAIRAGRRMVAELERSVTVDPNPGAEVDTYAEYVAAVEGGGA